MKTSYKMRLEAGSAIEALESALAIVRRSGATLCGIAMVPDASAMRLDLMIDAEDEDIFILCRRRFFNVVGILKIRELRQAAP
jgi:hypothetical protein